MDVRRAEGEGSRGPGTSRDVLVRYLELQAAQAVRKDRPASAGDAKADVVDLRDASYHVLALFL